MSDSRTGAQIMCEALINEGVEVMFGIPGGAIMPFYYAMWEYREKLRHVLCRHEQGAGHAAQGYARATGKLGVCIGTSGPGVTNLVTPIADAMMDSNPILAICGQVGSHVLGKDAFQETDITGITMPITKHNYLVKRAEELPYVFKEAIHIAITGRPGPVLIDITKDAMQKSVVPNWNIKLDLPGYKPTYNPNRKQVREALKLLANAKKPIIIAGNGVIMARHNELREFAERLRVPVITTLHGIGSFPEQHPLSLGMPGMHGWVHANRAIQECDVLFNIGGRFDDRVTGKASTFAPNARVIHVDIDPSEIGKNVKVTVPIVGDARLTLQALLDEMPSQEELAALHGNASDWMEHIRDLQDKHQGKQQYVNRANTENMLLPPHDVYDKLNQTLAGQNDGYILVSDVGQHQMWAAQLIDWNGGPRTHLTSGGAATMGFSVPAALGAAVAHPDKLVWVVCGDGGFQMTNQEMATIIQEGIKNVKVMIINNGYLGMVRQWQELFEQKRYSGTPLSGPNFAMLAEAYGWKGITVEHSNDVQAAIDEAIATDGPVLIDFRVEREVNVFPMVPQNKSIGEMITSEAEA